MSTALDATALADKSRLFALLDAPARIRLLQDAREENFEAGAVILREGDVERSFYVVLAGAVDVRVAQDNGAQKSVAQLGPGAVFGEIAALLGEARSATVAAAQPTHVLRIDGAAIDEVLRGQPKVREALVKLGLKRSEENLSRMFDTDS